MVRGDSLIREDMIKEGIVELEEGRKNNKKNKNVSKYNGLSFCY